MKNIQLKNKLIQAINDKGILNISEFNHSDPAKSSIISLYGTLKTTNAKRVNEFLNEFQIISKQKNIPAFKHETLKKLYEVWLKDSTIIDTIIYYSQKLKLELNDEHLWNTIGFHQGVNRSKYNAYLLSLFMGEKIITKENTQEYILLIKSILNIRIDKSLLLKTDLENEHLLKSRYNFMIFWCKLIIEKQISSYSKKNNLLTAVLLRNYPKNINPNFYNFIEALTQRMHISYIFRYSLSELEFVFKLYELNPTIFEYPIKKGNINRTDDIIKCFFQYYIIPEMFLDKFFSLDPFEQEWLFHIIQGEGMHTAKNLPLPLTKKAAHIFRGFSGYEGKNERINGRFGLSIEKGFILASFLSLGVSKEFSYGALRSIRNIEHSRFWVITLSNFYKKGLVEADLPLVIDYINDQVFNLKNNSNWKHKTINNLLQDSEQWHINTHLHLRPKEEENIVFTKSSISNYSIDCDPLSSSIEGYSIKQIITSTELYDEGRKLHHCAYSYSSDCESNSCQIFSMLIIDHKNEARPILTIELRENQIYQVRGKYNREPIDSELEIIHKWAHKEGLLCSF